ncbi:MFS transporter [Streptomyces abyssalis]|uniref:MFS transporter n=1 Tax=Streptomyces abyssalis TaxID=933944 RepID=A0A1E7JSF0_9ACTN|nr:MFS transporter [Streptomyces abyssalis]OEU91810.1 MFS transporter [Streptomyces abyssalis]OEU94050.1 MFS transporter [Streptomyces abyssalis]OEV06539.1 MFS transporter [Streptomyces nanshensis]
MTETAEPSGEATAAPGGIPPKSHRKLLAAGLIGSSIEWYDFFLYGTAAALVFPHVFFPSSSPLTATLLSFSTFWAGFIARPLGGILAGHFGDRYGRKPMVVVCLLGMGLATLLIGCLPSAEQIGVAAPTLLVVLRFVQGLACGGQWGGIVLLLTESTSPKRRGFAGTFGQMGVPFGVILGNVAFLAATAAMSESAFLSWGWRIPFLFSALLFPVVLYIQTKVEDTPEFRALQAEVSEKKPQKVARAPLSEAVRKDWRKILLACGTLAATNCLFYISIAGVLSYATEELHMSHESLLAVSLLTSLVGAGVILWSGALSDRVGRRPMVLIGSAMLILWAFPYFWLVDTRSLWLFFVALAVGSVFQSMTYGPAAAYIGELFAPNIRFSGASLAYQLAAITVSGATPLVMTALIAETGSTTLVSAFVALMGLITFCCAWALRETNPPEVRADPDAVPGELLHA